MAGVKRNPSRVDLRAVIRFLTAEGCRPVDIHHRMQAVYGDKSGSKTTVKNWTTMSKEGRLSPDIQANESPMSSGAMMTLRHIWVWRTVMILVLTPVALLPVIFVLDSKEADCAYVVLLMAIYWITESLPVGVTALLPVVLFPLFEIMPSNDVAAQYMNDVNMLFLGGLVMAIAIEYWNLHKRVALRILLVAGSNPRWLMLGMMCATWFLSMWISNTATTAMMIPIAEAVAVQLKDTHPAKKRSGKDIEMQSVKHSSDTAGVKDITNKSAGVKDITNGTAVVKDINTNQTSSPNVSDVTSKVETVKVDKTDNADEEDKNDDEIDDSEEEDPAFKRICKGMSLSICYAANSGGIASLTGTGPNLALKAHADSIYQERGLRNPVTFGTWMAFGLPLSVLILIVCWTWLQIVFIRCSCRKDDEEDAQEKSNRIKRTIREEYKNLGPMVFGQVVVFILFLVVVILWITRDLGGVTGWGQVFDPPVKDGAAAMLIAILLFAFPSTLPCLKSYSNPSHPSSWGTDGGRTTDKMAVTGGTWKVVFELLWDLVSGLSKWIGHELEFFSGWNQWIVLFIICYITAAATEVTSNTAIATLLMPIMSQLAINTGVHPLCYMFPTALACSFAFMLPIATPPNAIVFAYGRVRIIDMAVSGLLVNIVSVPVLIGITASVGNAIFEFDNIPVEFMKTNVSELFSKI